MRSHDANLQNTVKKKKFYSLRAFIKNKERLKINEKSMQLML